MYRADNLGFCAKASLKAVKHTETSLKAVGIGALTESIGRGNGVRRRTGTETGDRRQRHWVRNRRQGQRAANGGKLL